MKTSLITLVAAIAVAATGLPALAQENVVNIYNWSDYIAPDTVEKFTAETGIQVNYSTYDSNELLQSKLQVGSSGYDIIVPTGNFLQRFVEVGMLQPIDKTKLTNYGNLDPAALERAAANDPENAHSVPYMSFTVGLGYNVAKVTERLGAEQPIDSWDILFKPELVSKLADCGVAILDSPAEVVSTVLNYLGLDPNSEKPEDLTRAEEVLNGIRPHVRYFHSSQYIDDLGSGEICVALGYSGDVFIAADAAAEAGGGVEVAYVIPKEGVMTAFDLLAIPADAPHPENAHKFIDFILRPEVTAAISDTVFYASANKAATELVSEEVRNNPNIYPPAEVSERSFGLKPHSPAFDDLLTRTWTRIRTGV